MQQNRKYIDHLQERIQTKMEDQKLSVRELERKSGLSVGAVQNIINGRSSNPGIEFVASVAKALNCSVDELLNDSSTSRPKAENSQSKTVTWNAELYKDCTNKVEDYLKSKNIKPDSDKILELIKDVYLYALECHANQSDSRFIKWLIDKSFK